MERVYYFKIRAHEKMRWLYYHAVGASKDAARDLVLTGHPRCEIVDATPNEHRRQEQRAMRAKAKARRT